MQIGGYFLFSFPEALSFMVFICIQVNGSIRKLLKGGRDLDDSLIAAVIRNMKRIEVCIVFCRLPLH